MISSEEPRARLSVSQISVAGALIACHLFIFQIIVHFQNKKIPPLHQSSTDRWIGSFYTFPF